MFAHQVSAWQTIQWMRDPQPIERAEAFPPFQCDYKVFITSLLQVVSIVFATVQRVLKDIECTRIVLAQAIWIHPSSNISTKRGEERNLCERSQQSKEEIHRWHRFLSTKRRGERNWLLRAVRAVAAKEHIHRWRPPADRGPHIPLGACFSDTDFHQKWQREKFSRNTWQMNQSGL